MPIKHTAKSEIMEYCVNDDDWQEFRLSLKGIRTEQKLERLWWWVLNMTGVDREGNSTIRRVEVQVDNYLNALLRGGQLKRTADGTVVVQR
jgi:hypothetical protein